MMVLLASEARVRMCYGETKAAISGKENALGHAKRDVSIRDEQGETGEGKL